MSDGYNLNPGRRRRITSSTKASSTIRLSRPVEVVVRTKEACIGNSELEGFSVRDSTAAAGECRNIIGNLYDGKAVEQTVAFVKEQGTGTLLGLTSVRMGGNKEVRSNPFVPTWLRRLAAEPYVGLLARDDRFYNTVLADGSTRLSTVLVRAGIELVTPVGQSSPTLWAFVKRDNVGSLAAFARHAYHSHGRSRECEQEVLVRRAGKPLPPPPNSSSYRPACVREHPLAA
jgi:hypothetical protein